MNHSEFQSRVELLKKRRKSSERVRGNARNVLASVEGAIFFTFGILYGVVGGLCSNVINDILEDSAYRSSYRWSVLFVTAGLFSMGAYFVWRMARDQKELKGLISESDKIDDEADEAVKEAEEYLRNESLKELELASNIKYDIRHMSSRVVHFEIHADNVERCKEFYSKIFGWKMLAFPMPDGTTYWGIETGPKEVPGINGGIVERKGPRPAENAPVFGYVCTLQVENYDKAHEMIMANGGTLALAKAAIAGMAWQGYYKDTEGNIFGIHEPDANAK